MCLILDADKYSDFLNPNNSDLQPVRDWIQNKGGKLVYSPTKKLKEELGRHKRMKSRFLLYAQAGRVREVERDKVDHMEAGLTGLSSNDSHIVALALVAEVKLLVSGDTDLHDDFKNIVRGKVYQNPRHKNLLRQDTCP